MTLFERTLRGLGTERRALPVAAVCLPIAILESRLGGTRGALLALCVFTGFLLVGPYSYRALLSGTREVDRRWLRVLAFGAVDLAYSAFFGLLLPKLLHVRGTVLSDGITALSAPALFWAGSWALGRDMEWEATLEDVRARNEALAREAERAQLLALRTHLDPHFLFNTLNAIAEWCRQDPEVAERATLQLSSMLRTILAGVKANAWPLRDELQLVRQLLELYRTRDPQRFAFELAVAADAEQTPVPPMVVLSLVENAIKHGPAAGHAGRIEIRARVAGEHLHIVVSNPGPCRGPREGGEGLITLEKRLKLAYDGRAAMKHESDERTTTATLDLPVQLHGGAA